MNNGNGATNGTGRTRLSDRDRRALLLGGIVVLPVLLWITAARPYREALLDVRQRVAAERALLSREEGLLAAAPTLPEGLEQAEALAKTARGRLLPVAGATAAEAELIDRLESMASRSRVLLEGINGTTAPRGEKLPPGIQPITLGVDGQSDLEGVAGLLRRIERGPLILRVNQLSIEPLKPPARSNNRRGAPAPDVTGYVSFHMVIEGFAPLPEATGPTPPEKESGP